MAVKARTACSVFTQKILKISPFWWWPPAIIRQPVWHISLPYTYILLLSYFSLVISILMRFFSHKLPFFAFAMAYQSYFIASDFQVSLQEDERKREKKMRMLTGVWKKCWDLFSAYDERKTEKEIWILIGIACAPNRLGVCWCVELYDTVNDADKLLWMFNFIVSLIACFFPLLLLRCSLSSNESNKYFV